MTLTVRVLGIELLHVALEDAAAEEAGDYSSTAVGFTATFEQPDEAALPNRGWGD